VRKPVLTLTELVEEIFDTCHSQLSEYNVEQRLAKRKKRTNMMVILTGT
jgi:hypothetical protein